MTGSGNNEGAVASNDDASVSLLHLTGVTGEVHKLAEFEETTNAKGKRYTKS